MEIWVILNVGKFFFNIFIQLWELYWVYFGSVLEMLQSWLHYKDSFSSIYLIVWNTGAGERDLKLREGLKTFLLRKKCLIENLQYIFHIGHSCYCQLTLLKHGLQWWVSRDRIAGSSTGFWIGSRTHTVEQRKEREAWYLATPRFSSIFFGCAQTNWTTERRRWENERFKSDVGNTLQISIHSFFFCWSEYIKHRWVYIESRKLNSLTGSARNLPAFAMTSSGF